VKAEMEKDLDHRVPVRVARDREARDKLEGLIAAGMDSSKPVRASRAYWETKRCKLVRRASNPGASSERQSLRRTGDS